MSQTAAYAISMATRRPSLTNDELSFSLPRPYKEAYAAGLKTTEIRILLYLHALNSGSTSFSAITEDLLLKPPAVHSALINLRLGRFVTTKQDSARGARVARPVSSICESKSENPSKERPSNALESPIC